MSTLFPTLAILLTGFCLIDAAHADLVNAGEATIVFDPGDGFCALDRNADEFDRTVIEYIEELHAGTSVVLGYYMNCETIALSMQGREAVSGTYGILAAPTIDGELLRFDYDTIEDFITSESNSRNLTENEALTHSGLLSPYRVNDSMPPWMITNPAAIEINYSSSNPHEFHQENAVYSSHQTHLNMGFTTGLISGVTALAFANDYAIEYTLYRNDWTNDAPAILAEMVESIIADLLKRNSTDVENSAGDVPAAIDTTTIADNNNGAVLPIAEDAEPSIDISPDAGEPDSLPEGTADPTPAQNAAPSPQSELDTAMPSEQVINYIILGALGLTAIVLVVSIRRTARRKRR